MDNLKTLWGRLRVRWSVIGLALLAALPEILNYLSVIDLKPILTSFGLPESLIGLVPFLLIFAKSALHMTPKEPSE